MGNEKSIYEQKYFLYEKCVTKKKKKRKKKNFFYEKLLSVLYYLSMNIFHFCIKLVVWNVDSTQTNVWKLKNAPRIYSENIYKYNRMLWTATHHTEEEWILCEHFQRKKPTALTTHTPNFLLLLIKLKKSYTTILFAFSVEENVKKNIQTRTTFFFTLWEGKYSCISETYRHDRRVVWGFTFYLTKLFSTYIWNFLWCWWFFSLPAVLFLSCDNLSF
jgi:hypothetical protein